MKIYPKNAFGLFTGVSSVFDLGAGFQKKNLTPIARGLGFDMQQLSNDQNTLVTDYKKAVDKVMNEVIGD